MRPTPFRRALLSWYAERRRDLPWRMTRDPYAIWVSEIMLQQTTTRTVAARWERFLERFPDVESLARAALDDVLNEWSGLGYYTRARNLHAAAKRVADDFGGKVPCAFEELIALPGMGRYTAAAVASIAFDEPIAVLDANVERVLARLVAEEGDVKTARVKKRLWEKAQELLEVSAAGDWNQAMMELGATVCLPRAPQCSVCPVGKWCAARGTGEPERFPVKSAKPAMEEVREAAVVLRRGDKVLVLLRPPTGSFAGMWELPRGVVREGESSRDAAKRIVRELIGLNVRIGSPLRRLRHAVMRQKIELTVWQAEVVSGKIRAAEHVKARWMHPDEWLTLPISSTQRQIALDLAGREDDRKSASKPDDDIPDLFTES